MNNIVVSPHARARFLERYDIELAEDCNCMADRAWRNGKSTDCFSARMRKYLKYIETKYNNHTVLKIHSKNCYVFDRDGTLKTVYTLKRYEEYINPKPPRFRELGGAA